MSTSPSSPPAVYRVALVMIARDEAARIERALASFAPFVDECVVLDTGSRDDTASRAQRAGARVEHFQWVDDFAAARNGALDAARADWHVVVDADEWLADGGAAIAALRQQAPTFVGSVRVDSDDDATALATRTSSWISRVLPGALRYAGRVHEQPVHALAVQRLPIRFGHDGYLGAQRTAKAGRNRALLEAAVQAAPADAYLHYQLGKDHDVYERYAEALDAFARAEALLGSRLPTWCHDLAVRRLHALKRCGRHAEGLQCAEHELGRWGESPDFFFALGDLLLDWAADEPARAGELLPLIESAWQRCLALGERPDLEGAVAGRGSHLAAANLVLLYEQLGQPELAAPYRPLLAPA
ncbi:glycosyltransferase family 2 protein [Ideonella sp.]|uniref:glycosyltransferase family 2 protein n=1 Tax=Ideonella sp. TaxID=1929293 RepID=UPI002B4784AE|nr:glycosyltransferase family 2 protein [Ideonella sp.]HJV67936.1 glycosyltransferase family 2 protein [Ideonella sp.]